MKEMMRIGNDFYETMKARKESEPEAPARRRKRRREERLKVRQPW